MEAGQLESVKYWLINTFELLPHRKMYSRVRTLAIICCLAYDLLSIGYLYVVVALKYKG